MFWENREPFCRYYYSIDENGKLRIEIVEAGIYDDIWDYQVDQRTNGDALFRLGAYDGDGYCECFAYAGKAFDMIWDHDQRTYRYDIDDYGFFNIDRDSSPGILSEKRNGRSGVYVRVLVSRYKCGSV